MINIMNVLLVWKEGFCLPMMISEKKPFFLNYPLSSPKFFKK